MERINCLWTGGLDSTYTVAYFSRFEVEIQPYYILDKHRDSQKYELKAISEISNIIRMHKDTKAKILPIITAKVEDIAPDAEITAAYKKYRARTGIGSQYDWLARFAKQRGIDDFYMSFILSPHGRRNDLIEHGHVKRHEQNGYIYYKIDEETADEEIRILFERMRFPVSWDTTKRDEFRILKEMGLEEVAKRVWFCFTPVNGEKCGTCNPCRFYIQDGLSDIFSEEALKRYERFEKTPHWVHQLRDYKNLALIKLGLK